MIVYDPRNLTWDEWCARMAELFAANQLGTLPEEEWRVWADAITGIGYFTESGVPDSRMFPDWRSWAEQFVGIMNIKRR